MDIQNARISVALSKACALGLLTVDEALYVRACVFTAGAPNKEHVNDRFPDLVKPGINCALFQPFKHRTHEK